MINWDSYAEQYMKYCEGDILGGIRRNSHMNLLNFKGKNYFRERHDVPDKKAAQIAFEEFVKALKDDSRPNNRRKLVIMDFMVSLAKKKFADGPETARAIAVDFINFVAACAGMDYGIYSRDLTTKANPNGYLLDDAAGLGTN